MVKQVKVGIVVTVAAVFLLLGLRWLSGWRVTRARYQVELKFRNAGGLKRADRVLVYGVLKGRVKEVQLAGDGALVKIWLESDVSLKEDASAEIEGIGLLGGAKVLLDPGKSEKPYDGSKPITGSSGTDLSKLMNTASNILDTTNEMLETISNEFFSADDLKRIDRIILTLDEATRDFKFAASELKELLGDNRKDLHQSIDRVEGITKSLDSLLVDIKNGKGTAGKLLSDDQLYEQLVKGIEELRELIKDIKNNPRKYFRLF